VGAANPLETATIVLVAVEEGVDSVLGVLVLVAVLVEKRLKVDGEDIAPNALLAAEVILPGACDEANPPSGVTSTAKASLGVESQKK
jgi:hypothetical protein